MKRPMEENLVALLNDIEKGKVSIALDTAASADALKNENGVYYFDTSKKWRMGVFVDCGWFDYIDSLQHGGTRLDSGTLNQHYPTVVEYSRRFRDHALSKSVWGIEAKIYGRI
ncbi:hypothetical protein HYX14_02090 [Candidatus Woesearchaeota archaeon]|nr:hypothetical protein [Candidatus Woesearchaeota archaeon]